VTDDPGLAQGPFALGGLFGQDMAAMGFGIGIFAGSCFFKTLGRGSIGFNFRHAISPYHISKQFQNSKSLPGKTKQPVMAGLLK
jgi:hypothetical protein